MTVSVISIIHISKTSLVSFAHLDAKFGELSPSGKRGTAFYQSHLILHW